MRKKNIKQQQQQTYVWDISLQIFDFYVKKINQSKFEIEKERNKK
jgi:hypothetical protein